MKQSGTYHIYKVENNIRVISPIANAYLYFIQNDAIKLTAKTDDKGKFNFDLPLGSYIVGSASEGGIEQILANGSKFTLDASSKLDAFEKWINAPSADVDSELLKRFRELAKQSQDAADEAQKILDQMNAGSIGEGKWLKETSISNKMDIGDYGIGGYRLGEEGYTKVPMPKNIYNTGRQTLTAVRQTIPQEESHAPRENQLYGGIAIPRSLRPCEFGVSGIGLNATFHYRGFSSPESLVTNWHQVYSDRNTTVDSNGFIKKASPIIKLFDDRIEANDQFYDEPIFEKIGTGTYKISNTKGLSKDGWTYEKPRGGDGTPYFRIEVTKLEDGCIISVHDEYDSLEEATITGIDGNTRTINKVVKVLGEARDIKPNERWIDLRFEEDHERIAQEEERNLEAELLQ